MKRSLPVFLILIGTVLCLSALAFAENDPDRGRLPDGRAFRKDDQGNQLVDYIAELEVNIEQLERQVQALEDDLKDKQTTIEKLQLGQSTATKVSEKTIIEPEKAARTAPCPPATECQPLLSQTASDLESARADLDIERKVSSQKIEGLTAELASLRSTLESQTSELDRLKLELTNAKSEGDALRSASDVLKEELVRIKAEQTEAAKPLEAPQPVVAARIEPEVAPLPLLEARASLDLGRTSLSAARARAVESLRGKMLTDINKIKGLIGQRDELYSRYASKRRTVAFKPSTPVSSKNRNLEEIIRAIKAASSVYELSGLSREIGEIQAKLQDDINLMNRMRKVG